MWWIWIILLIEAVGCLLVAGLLLTAAPRSETERCYEDEAQVRALANWRASGGRGWVATDGPSKPQDFGQLVEPSPSQGLIRADLPEIGSPHSAFPPASPHRPTNP
jgi:hypothetical protein